MKSERSTALLTPCLRPGGLGSGASLATASVLLWLVVATMWKRPATLASTALALLAAGVAMASALVVAGLHASGGQAQASTLGQPSTGPTSPSKTIKPRKPPPPKAWTTRAETREIGSASLNGAINPRGVPTVYYFQYGSTSRTGASQQAQEEPTTGTKTTQLGRLFLNYGRGPPTTSESSPLARAGRLTALIRPSRPSSQGRSLEPQSPATTRRSVATPLWFILVGASSGDTGESKPSEFRSRA